MATWYSVYSREKQRLLDAQATLKAAQNIASQRADYWEYQVNEAFRLKGYEKHFSCKRHDDPVKLQINEESFVNNEESSIKSFVAAVQKTNLAKRKNVVVKRLGCAETIFEYPLNLMLSDEEMRRAFLFNDGEAEWA